MRYSTVSGEYEAARAAVALMDRGYLGVLRVSGADHLDLLHRLSTNELRHLQPGQGQGNIFTNEKGRIVERTVLLRFENDVRLITHPENPQKLADWIARFIFLEDVQVENLSGDSAVLTLVGPNAAPLLERSLGLAVGDLSPWHFRRTSWHGQELVVYRTAELKPPAFDLLAPVAGLPELWDTLLAGSAGLEVQPLGLEAYDILRIEAGWPLYGQDFDEEMNPHEAGLAEFINLDKGCYIGQEVIARLDTYDKVQKRLVGFLLGDGPQPAHRDRVLKEGQEVGFLTSLCHSPCLQQNIALGYLRAKLIAPGTTVQIATKEGDVPAQVVELPFDKGE